MTRIRERHVDVPPILSEAAVGTRGTAAFPPPFPAAPAAAERWQTPRHTGRRGTSTMRAVVQRVAQASVTGGGKTAAIGKGIAFFFFLGDRWVGAIAAVVTPMLGGEEPPLLSVLPARAADPSASARELSTPFCLFSLLWLPPSLSTGLCVLVGFAQDDAAADVDHV